MDAAPADAPIVAQNIGSAGRGSRPRSADGTEGSLDARLRSRTIQDRGVGVPAEVTTVLRQDPGVFASGICTLQQGHNRHRQSRRERPRGRGLIGPWAPAAGSFTSRFRSCTGPVADRSGIERRSFSGSACDAQVAAHGRVAAGCVVVRITSPPCARVVARGLRHGVENADG